MVASLISRLVVLTVGTLYPAYQSYKAVKRRNAREYVKWMMYWIVFALFSCVETVADIFASILPFYYELKILFIIWLISPWTRGSTYLYRKFVHPTLSRKEHEIDEYLNQASTKGIETLKKVGTEGLTIAANVMVTSAVKGQSTILDQINILRQHSLQKTIQQQIIPEESTDYAPAVEFSAEDDSSEAMYSSADDLLDTNGRGSRAISQDMVQSMNDLDNRLRDEQDLPEPQVMHESLQGPSSRERRRKRLTSEERYRPERQESDEDSDSYKRKTQSLRRSTSMRSTKGLYPSTENLEYSKSRFSSSESLAGGRTSRRRKEQIRERASRHRQTTTKSPSRHAKD